MYGSNGQLARRMEHRLREKIYREMIQEPELYKSSMREKSFQERGNLNRLQTEPIYRDTINSRKPWKKEPARHLEHKTTFLPIINHNKSKRYYEKEGFKQNYTNNEALSHRSRKRQKGSHHKLNIQNDSEEEQSQATIDRDRIKTLQDELNEEKAKVYLSQCERILGNLKELTYKGSRKLRSQSSKYDVQQSYIRNKQSSQSRQDIERTQRTKSYTPIQRDKLSQLYLQPEIKRQRTNSYSINALRLSMKESLGTSTPGSTANFNEFNQLSFPQHNVVTQKPNCKIAQKVKQNHRKIEPILKEAKPIQQEEPQVEAIDKLSHSQKTPEKNHNKVAENESSNQRLKNKLSQKSQQSQHQIEKRPQVIQTEKKSSQRPQQTYEDSETTRKKHNAIVKYLKKARACGSLLYQKVEGHKRDQPETGGNVLS